MRKGFGRGEDCSGGQNVIGATVKDLGFRLVFFFEKGGGSCCSTTILWYTRGYYFALIRPRYQGFKAMENRGP